MAAHSLVMYNTLISMEEYRRVLNKLMDMRRSYGVQLDMTIRMYSPLIGDKVVVECNMPHVDLFIFLMRLRVMGLYEIV